VVLTPAVYAATRAAKVEPLPYLFVCAFIANAASFVLPISNPANLVLYAGNMPPLFTWLGHFIIPSALSIAATYGALRLTQRASLRQALATDVPQPSLSAAGRTTALGIAATAFVLLGASAAGLQLGLPTALAGLATATLVLGRKREAPWRMLGDISWAILPLVAGLFMLVAGLGQTGVLAALSGLLHRAAQESTAGAAWGAGIVVALAGNVINNLPAGLIAGSSASAGEVPHRVRDALLIGVDVGPNLSVTGSLATILWLVALRREGVAMSFGRFLRLGAVVMPPALLLALAGLLLVG
jgi:arsenical pump membrane protein